MKWKRKSSEAEQLTQIEEKWGGTVYRVQTNRTAVESQRLISDAMRALMREKTFQQITVTALCEAAGVGRKTFYRNFEVREDVILYQLDALCAQYREAVGGMAPREMLRHHFAFVSRYADYFIDLYRDGFQQMMHKRFSVLLPEMMPRWPGSETEQRYKNAYIIGGLQAMQQVWIENGCGESVEQLAALAEGMMKTFV